MSEAYLSWLQLTTFLFLSHNPAFQMGTEKAFIHLSPFFYWHSLFYHGYQQAKTYFGFLHAWKTSLSFLTPLGSNLFSVLHIYIFNVSFFCCFTRENFAGGLLHNPFFVDKIMEFGKTSMIFLNNSLFFSEPFHLKCTNSVSYASKCFKLWNAVPIKDFGQCPISFV